MSTSQNGFTVHEEYGGTLVSNPIPGSGMKFLGGLDPAADVLLRYVGYRWHTEVEPILGPETETGQWGYNYRAIRGQSSGFSNHASGTAVDINSAAHPLGTRTLSGEKLSAIARIRDDLEGVVRFGAFYDGRPDEMHAELNASAGACAAMTARIRAGQLPNVPAELLINPGTPATPTPPPVTPADWFDMATEADLRKIVSEELAKVSAADDKVLNPETGVSQNIGTRLMNISRVVQAGFADIGTRLAKLERKVK